MSDGYTELELKETRIDPSQWSDAIADTDGPQIVVGGPGTGKTEFLARRVEYLLANGAPAASLLVLSFGRRGVADLRSRINAQVGSVGDLDVSTFHSYASRLLEAWRFHEGLDKPVQLLTGPEQLALVQETLGAESPLDWSPAFRPLLKSKTFAREVTDFILRAAEQLLDVEAIAKMDRADWRGLAPFIQRYQAKLHAMQRTDYGTLLQDAVALLWSDKLPTDWLPKYVLVDEYQDTTFSQAAMLTRGADHNRNVTVAADPHQSIYSFRGARLENVVDFPGRFSKMDGEPVKRIVLTTSFRTPAVVLDAAVQVAEMDPPGAVGKVTPASAGGAVEIYVFGQQTEEAEWVAAEIERLYVTQESKLADMAVLVRSKQRFLPELSRALERRGITHDLPDSRLSDHPAIRFVLDMVSVAVDTKRPVERRRALRRVMLGSTYQLTLSKLRQVEQLLTASPWHDGLRAADFPELAELVDDPSWAESANAADGSWRLWTAIPALGSIAKDPTRAEDRLAWRSLIQVLERWTERNPEATLLDYRRLTEDEEFEAQPLLSFRLPDGDRLTVTTLHQAKGLEFDVTFICDAVEGVFPDLRVRDSLLGVRHLLTHVPTESSAYAKFRLQEERRLAYTAMTRTRRRVIWTATTAGPQIGRGAPSRFLTLLSGDTGFNRPSHDQPPVSPRQAEAHLRRRLADPAAPQPERLAALSALARGPRWDMRHPLEQFGVAARGPDRGLLPDRPRLSPSQADSYSNCPRRYAIEARLGQAGDSIYLRFGNLVHEVLEKAEGDAIAAGKPRSTFDDAAKVLDDQFDQTQFGGEPFATAWFQRAKSGIEHLYSNWPTSSQGVGTEVRLTIELGDAQWSGRIDRIERDGDQLHIIDYKTSKSPMTKKDAGSSLQLGFYMLAVAADPSLAALGKPASAEAWYPMVTNRNSLATRAFDPTLLQETSTRLTEISRRIRSEDWEPTPGRWCERCAFASSCPRDTRGGDQFS